MYSYTESVYTLKEKHRHMCYIDEFSFHIPVNTGWVVVFIHVIPWEHWQLGIAEQYKQRSVMTSLFCRDAVI